MLDDFSIKKEEHEKLKADYKRSSDEIKGWIEFYSIIGGYN